MTRQPDKIVARIYATRGLSAEIARACGISRQAINQWKRVPPQQVLTVATIMGLTPEQIRPDVFRPKKRPVRRPMALLKDRNEQLTRINLDQAERIAALEAREENGSLFDLARDRAEDIAKTIVATVGVRRARAIHHLLGGAIAAAPKPKPPKRPAG